MGLLILSPLFIIIAIFIAIDSKGGVFFIQERIGKNGMPFKMIKFRTMKSNSDFKGMLTIGEKDPRVTKLGYYLRKFKIDELPQLFNVLVGEMSIVGPRPEVKRYVDLYDIDQMKVLSVRPGITDFASIEYRDESVLLAKSDDPEKFYIDNVMPTKLTINLEYMRRRSIFSDTKIIFKTFLAIFR